jgi:hypothetical protein
MTVKEKLVAALGDERAKKVMKQYVITETERVGFRLSEEFVKNLIERDKNGLSSGNT